ncbi:MAG: hypothetical protein K0Q79_1296 [Flavipsychrobacter sp.]|jgi:hypothetical protein|nr:hypothetical protein [Flavipsychrobacter sp.]
MGFYHKRLKGVDDLKREKRALLRQKEELDDEPFFSLDGVLGKGKKGSTAQRAVAEDEVVEGSGFGMEDILSLLPVLSPAFTLVSSLAGKIFAKGKGENGQKEKGLLSKVVSDVVWGYLKWKAIELSIKGVRHMMKKKKEKEGQR